MIDRDAPSAPTEAMPGGFLAPGQVLGDRYQIKSQLGRGGMGEVWRAFDLKLRVEVALKALREDLFKNEHRLELLRREVRAAREVVSPNVCRIFDLIEVEGHELVSMEYVDGGTLLGVLQERGPLDLKEAQDIASQFLAGLEAIHQVGLVHRDVKPENIMITRAGRVVLMDFGLAKQEDSGAGTVSGTPAYMAPEQAAGLKVDARADVYSAGVVLAEMVSPEGIKSFESRQSVWEGIRQEPSKVPDSPWAPVLKKAVAKEPAQRYNSAHTLTRALEDVTLRVEGAEDLHPYPGLASFTEEDAEYFFGREAEVEAMWAKLERPHLMALIGPSGAGKSSFLRAGVIPAAPAGWRCVVCTPGGAPFVALGQAMAFEMAGDAEAMQQLLRFEEQDVALELLAHWREKNQHALLIVDQFEELFTQNTPEVQARFAALMGRLALEADVHVLLSMRDDFLFHCHAHSSLAPLYDSMTPLGPPSGQALRRALVQPATTCGYRFEDDALVEEMLAEVEGERGTLPMLAFAAARLWEKRDRDDGLLTRRAYQDIGGVGGALARHAEATIDRIGSQRIPVVRELFRNLVTAEGTRAVRDWEELLSVFQPGDLKRAGVKPAPTKEFATSGKTVVGAGFIPARESAEEVLRELIDARLLTSYEVKEEDREPTRRVEIIHESLLANWPRLVRWQTQDADAAQLRDQLRQAARTWDEHGRSADLLWTGTAFREYQVWRERYPGGLTDVEEAFGLAMTRHAERRRRRRRVAVAATFAVLLAILAIVGGFWRRSISEARRAEAANLFSVAQLMLLDERLTAAVAFATASLERADNPEVRRLALDALQRRPAVISLPASSAYSIDFSPDGHWLVTADPQGGAKLWPSDGGPPTVLEGCDVPMEALFSPRGDLVAANMGSERRRMGLWSVPEGRLLHSFSLGEQGETMFFRFSGDGTRLITSTENKSDESSELELRSWPVEGGEPDPVAHLVLPAESKTVWPAVDFVGSRLAWAEGRRVRIARLEGTTLDRSTAISIEHDDVVAAQVFDKQGRQLAISDKAGKIRIWSLASDPPALTHTLTGEAGLAAVTLVFDPSGSMLVTAGGLWDLTAPPDSEPISFIGGWMLAFHPTGKWVASSSSGRVALWPLARTYPRVLRGHEESILGLAFTADGKRLVSSSQDGSVRLWPLEGGASEGPRILHQAEGIFAFPGQIAMAPDGSFVVSGNPVGQVFVHPLDGQPIRELKGFSDGVGVAVGPGSRLVAAGAGGYDSNEAFVRVWDLESGEIRILDAADGRAVSRLEFTPDGDLWVWSGWSGSVLRRWHLVEGQLRMVEELDLSSIGFADFELCDFATDSRRLLLRDEGRIWIHDLGANESHELSSHSDPNTGGFCGFDPNNDLVISSHFLGMVRVGPVTGEEPHLLTGHETYVRSVAVSPDGQWIATGADDGTIRLWPMPDFSKPPLHSLPREELIAKLKTLTNFRAVRDPTSSLGWEIEFAHFPGWETVPSW